MAGLPWWVAVLVGATAGFVATELVEWHLRRRAARVTADAAGQHTRSTPEHIWPGATYAAYHRQLYPEFYGDNPPHWYGRWKTLENCHALADQRDLFCTRFDADYYTDPADAHYSTTVTAYARTLLRDVTARVCVRCNWVSGDLHAPHGDWVSAGVRAGVEPTDSLDR